MAKIDNDSPFGDSSYQKKLNKVKLDPSRQNLKPVDAWLTFDEYLAICLKEGAALLEAEEKEKADSVKSKDILEDTLGKMSENPYINARVQILQKMSQKARSVIEQMEKGSLDKDSRYDKFVKAVTELGDKLSSNN